MKDICMRWYKGKPDMQIGRGGEMEETVCTGNVIILLYYAPVRTFFIH